MDSQPTTSAASPLRLRVFRDPEGRTIWANPDHVVSVGVVTGEAATVAEAGPAESPDSKLGRQESNPRTPGPKPGVSASRNYSPEKNR